MQYCTKCGAELEQKSAGEYICANGHPSWVNPIVSGVAYIVDDDRVLYGVRSREPHIGRLNTPGGFVELNETVEEATKREVREELGVDIEIIEYLGSYVASYNDARPVINIVYVTRLQSPETPLKPGDDLNAGEPVWRNITDLPTESELSWDWQLAAQNDLVKWHAQHQDHA